MTIQEKAMLLEHVRLDGDIAYFSYPEVRWLKDMEKKLMSGGEEDEN